MSKANEQAAATIRAVCTPYPEISTDKVDLVCEIIRAAQLTDGQVGKIRDIIENENSALEKPMPIAEAARLLGVTKQSIHFHIRAGRIRRVTVPGASRGRGVVAADVRRILNGEAA